MDLQELYNDSFNDELMKIAEENKEKRQNKGTAAMVGGGILGTMGGLGTYRYNSPSYMNKTNRAIMKSINDINPSDIDRKALKAMAQKSKKVGRIGAGATLLGGSALAIKGISDRSKYNKKNK